MDHNEVVRSVLDAVTTLTGEARDYRRARADAALATNDNPDPRRPAAREALATNDNSDPNDSEQRMLELADRIWRTSSPLPPEAIAYFHRRNIDIGRVPRYGGLRFHPRCPMPCIVGRFTTAISNEPRGIWRRPLTGEKPKSLGPMAGCVIRLWPDAAVECGLVLGEGVETVLAAATRIGHRGTMPQPAWAACTAGNMASFPVLAGIEALTLLVDNDQSGTGQRAAAACTARWLAAGCEVTRLTPNEAATDFNDVALAYG
jgi:hypothetical protein